MIKRPGFPFARRYGLRSALASTVVAGAFVVLPASAWAASKVSGAATCSVSGLVSFSHVLSASGGGTAGARIAATLSGCVSDSLVVEGISSATLTGRFSSSPFACGSSSPTGAPVSARIRWHARVWPRGGLAPTSLVDGGSSGSFAGAALLRLDVPGVISAGCGGGVRSTTVSGTVELGPMCGHVGNPISIYVIAPPICGAPPDSATSITSGPDGALWFPLNDGRLIGRMTPSGSTTTYPSPISGGATWGNGGITVGSDGALWYLANGEVGRIATDGSTTAYPLPPGLGGPVALTAGPDGALWFVYNSLTANGIGRLTPSGQFTSFTDPSLGSSDWNNANHRDLMNITTGPDGALWFAMFNAGTSPATGWIGRISTAGVVSTFSVPFPSQPEELTTGPDGAIWFAGPPVCWRVSASPNVWTCHDALGRLSLSGSFSQFTSSTGQIGLVMGITAGPDGALWFTNYNSPGQQFVAPPVARITTDGTITGYSDPGMQGTQGITVGPDGALWFSDLFNGTIGRVSVP